MILITNLVKQHFIIGWISLFGTKCFFSLFRSQLEGTLGIQAGADTKQELSIDRNSDPSLDTKVKDSTKDLKELNEEKRRSARRKE